MRHLIGSLIVVLATMFLAVPPASADTVSDIISLTPNDRTSTEFPSFTSISRTVTEDQEPIFLANIETLVRSGTHDATFDTAVALTEADGSVSDVVLLHIVSTNGTQTWTVSFASDAEGVLPPILSMASPPGTGNCPQNGTPNESCIVRVAETGGMQDISALFTNSDGATRITPLFTISVQSDVETVPEASTALLLVSSLAALAGVARRRGRRRIKTID